MRDAFVCRSLPNFSVMMSFSSGKIPGITMMLSGKPTDAAARRIFGRLLSGVRSSGKRLS